MLKLSLSILTAIFQAIEFVFQTFATIVSILMSVMVAGCFLIFIVILAALVMFMAMVI